MRKFRRLLSGIVSVALATSMFSACSAPQEEYVTVIPSSKPTINSVTGETPILDSIFGKNDPTPTPKPTPAPTPTPDPVKLANMDGDVQLNVPGELPLVLGDPVTVSAFTSISIDKFSDFDSEVNSATRWYEEQTNTHFEWTIVTQAEKLAKLNLIFECGEYTDIIFMSYLNGTEQFDYAQQGFLVDLKPYQDGDDAFWWNKFKALGLEKGTFTQRDLDEFTMPDGGVYSLGQINTALQSRYSARMYVFQPWLDTMGAEMPTTTDEFYDLLRRMKNEDPNLNGSADEIPLSGSYTKGWNCDPTMWLMNSFLYYDKNTKMYVDNGEVKFACQQDEYKNGLEFMRKLYSEGLLDPSYIEQSNEDVKNKTSGSVNNVGFVSGGLVSQFVTSVQKDDYNYLDKFISVPPLAGPDGVGYSWQNNQTMSTTAHITNNCETPRTAFRMLDYMYEEECGVNLKYGLGGTVDIPEEEKAWVYCEPDTTELAINGEKPTWRITEASNNENVGWGNISSASEQPGWYEYQSIGLGYPENNMNYVLNKDAHKYEIYAPDESIILPNLIFESKDQGDRVATLRMELNSIIDQWYALIVTSGEGAGDFDAAWENFQYDLENAGIEEYMELNQKAYEDRMAVLGY